MLRVGVEKTTNHALILGLVSRRLLLEEFHAAPAESKRYLHTLVAEHQFPGRGKKVRNQADFPEGLIRVFDSCAHRSAYLSARNPHHRFGPPEREM